MKKILLILVFLTTYSISFAQEKSVINLTPQEIESIFLKENLELIAEKMNIDIAEATILQTKLWENPEISVSDINLWSNGEQRDELDANSFPKNRQFSIELSQMIETANKKGKLVRLEKISKQITEQEFEETLQGLKLELRNTVNELLYSQQYCEVLEGQIKSIGDLVNSYKKQVNEGNIAKSELLRLQASLLELENEYNEVSTEYNSQQKTIKSLLNANPLVTIQVKEDFIAPQNPTQIFLPKLLDISKEKRAEVKQGKLQRDYMSQNISYEKSLRVPDLTLSANYDRRGGVWKDFVGFGFSFNLPFLDRNQGNIKIAKISHKQSEYLLQEKENKVQHEVVEAYENYNQAYKFYEKISNDDLTKELDSMLDIYKKNLLNRNISMLEYVDFIESYKTSKETALNARKNIQNSFNELEYTIGTELK